MTLSDFLRVLRLRWRAICACVLLGIVAATGLSLATTPMYRSTATLFLAAAGGDTESVSGAYTGTLFTQQRVRTFREFVSSPTVAERAADATNSDISPAVLAQRITAETPPDTTLLDISVADESPARAALLAQAVAESFTNLATELEGGSGGAAVRFTVVRPAAVPDAPFSPRTRLNLALGTLIGLALGIAYAVARESLDTRVKNLSDVAAITGSPNLATVAYDADASKRPLIVQASPRAPRSESFRQLRTNLQFIDVDNPPRSLVVTSAVPSEGKTTTTCNLAIALAQTGRQTLLVEADLRRPRIGDYLGIESAVGLTDVLVGRLPIEEALQAWAAVPGLFVLPSGVLPPNPSELLGSAHMRALLSELERDYLVVIDAPPLLPVTDAAVLAAAASGAILVVRAGSTRKDEVRRAVEAVRAVGGRVFGTVYNMAPTRGPDAYAYGYGYGYEQEDPNRRKGRGLRSERAAAPSSTVQ